MGHQKRIYLSCLLFLAALFCLQADHANGARVAGDNKVVTSAPEPGSPDTNAMVPAPGVGVEPENGEMNTPPSIAPTQGEATDFMGMAPPQGNNVAVDSMSPEMPVSAGPGEADAPAADISPPPGIAPIGDNASQNTGNSSNKRSTAKNTAKSAASSNSSTTLGDNYIIINFKDADIIEFIKYISELTGKNFLIDSNVKGKITIFSPAKITIEEAYKVFESVLEVNGYTIVPSGSVTKILPMTEARTKDIDTKFQQESTDPEDKLVTQLIPLKYASPDEIKTLFTPFISKNSVMASYAPTGMLIITDVLSNINRLLEIIDKIDVEGTNEIISVLPLEYAGAESMAKSLTSIFKTGTTKSAKDASSSSLVIISDTRTNSIITLASEVDTLKIKELIKLLDKEAPKGEGDIHVYYLQNASAEDLAKVLTSLPTGTTTSSAAAKEGVKETAVVLSKDVQILADKATNSLVINAGKDDYLVLEDIIRKLDITRKMVYIEALIMEVSMTKQFELGVQWYGGKETGSIDGNDVVTFGSSNTGTSIIDTSGNFSLPTGLSLGVLGDTITIGDFTFPSIQAFVRAYGTNSDVHILSTPQVMTLDNEEASINVSDNVPYLTSRQETTSGNDYSNYDFKDVGVKLTITPQINQERFVKLKIAQEVSQLVSQTEVGLPTTLKREAKTTVMIKDGQTVVIGGLIDETKSNASYKVPVLGSIPILGYLFRAKTASTDKKNLYIFITPHIVENPAEAEEVYENKIGQMDKVKEGVVSMNKARASRTKDERLSDIGFSYMQVKEYDKAAEYYEKAIKANPENPVALLNMGIIYENKKEYPKAIEMYEKVIALDSEKRTYDTVNPAQTGKKATDIAKENLEKIKDGSD